MKYLKTTIGLMLLLLTSFTNAPERTVYICNGPQSVAYHLTSKCRGLDRCSTEIQALTESQAINKGRRLCKICGKH
ncbi:MAG: hypothetical protein J6Z01_14490 [Bacteroidales bacterium]|nr:hypothetical protein [Bacteroidales bacterium]